MQVFSCESQFLIKSNSFLCQKSHFKGMELKPRQPHLLKCCAKEKEFLTIYKKNNFFDLQILKMKIKSSSLRALVKLLKNIANQKNRP